MPDTVTAAEVAVQFARAFDVCVFATSLVAKTRRRDRIDDFVVAVSQLAPRAPARLTAGAVLGGEFLVVFSLVAGGVALGLTLVLVMVSAFTVSIAAAVRAKRRVACQCFGQSAGPVSVVHLVRNATILGVTLIGLGSVLYADGAGPAARPVVPTSSASVGAMTVALVAAACVVVADKFSDVFVLNSKEQ